MRRIPIGGVSGSKGGEAGSPPDAASQAAQPEEQTTAKQNRSSKK